MSTEVLDLSCRGCGAPISVDTAFCKYCGGPVTVSTFNSVKNLSFPSLNKYIKSYDNDLRMNPGDSGANKAVAYCYLKLNMYDKALEYFERAVEDNFDDSELYFYTAVCCLQGKKAYLALRPQINKAEQYLSAAVRIEPKGVYYYFWAYIKYDYYKRKFLNTTPDFVAMLNMAQQAGVSAFDKDQLFAILNVERPAGF